MAEDKKKPSPTDDDVLNEIKETLDKVQEGKATPESKFERITQEDFQAPEELEKDAPAAVEEEKPEEPEDNSFVEYKKEPENIYSDSKRQNTDSLTKRRTSSEKEDTKTAERTKKGGASKAILLILILIIVAAGAFALVRYVITPRLGANGTNAQTGATADEAETIAPTESAYAALADDALNTMSRREKICQLFMVTPEMLMNSDTVTVADNTTKDALDIYPVGGVIFTQQNYLGEEQMKALIEGTQSYAKTPLFIAYNDNVIASSGQSGSQSNDTQSSTSADDVNKNALNASQQKKEIGYNLDLSLSTDTFSAGESSDSELNTLLSSAVKGTAEGGVIPSLKYFPGTDSDNESGLDSFSHLTRTVDEINNGSQFTLFRAGIEAGAGMVMVDHTIVDKLDTERPATLSDKVVPELLRDKLNYQGVAITGDMSVGYFTREYSYSTIVKGIFASDIDVILNPNSIMSYVDEIESKLDNGDITEAQLNAKVKRILTLKYQSGIISGSAAATEANEAAAAATESVDPTTVSAE